MNKTYLTLTLLAILALPVTQAYAGEDKLQERADMIMRGEPDAKKVHVREEVTPKATPNKKSINLMEFDLNDDGRLTQEEVGEKLFKVFDRDHNGVIDNREMKKVGLITLAPMQRKTTETIEYKSLDHPTKTTINEEEFLHRSQLVKFDKDEDGLTPLDFLGMTFLKVNVKKDDVIDLYEWKRAYAESVRGKHQEQYNYND